MHVFFDSEFRLVKKELEIVGDGVFTDVVRANRMGSSGCGRLGVAKGEYDDSLVGEESCCRVSNTEVVTWVCYWLE